MLNTEEVNHFLRMARENFKEFDFAYSAQRLTVMKADSLGKEDMDVSQSLQSMNPLSESTHYTDYYSESVLSLYSQKNPGFRKNELIAKSCGTTANILYIKDRRCYLANVGDSIAYMYKGEKAIKMNNEHKTSLHAEETRILKAGSRIVNNRVDGKLNLTRAIGDLCFKTNTELKPYEQAVTAYPEINKFSLNDVEFIVMGCDGIWDCVDAQKLCEFISGQIKQAGSDSLEEIISHFMDQIISKVKDCKLE